MTRKAHTMTMQRASLNAEPLSSCQTGLAQINRPIALRRSPTLFAELTARSCPHLLSGDNLNLILSLEIKTCRFAEM